MKSFTKITHAFTKITGLTLFSLFFISCADILKKQNNIQITIPPVHSIQANELPPPLAHTNNFSTSARAPSPTTPSDFYCVFGALCRPLPKHSSGSEQNEVFKMVAPSDTKPLSIGYTAYDLSTSPRESSPYDIVLDAIKTHQANDENKEFIALASLNNVIPSKEITLNFPPVEIGQEFYISVYIMHYFFDDAEGVWAEEIYKMYYTAEPIYRFDDDLNTYYFFDNEPKSIRADSNYMIVPLIERGFEV